MPFINTNQLRIWLLSAVFVFMLVPNMSARAQSFEFNDRRKREAIPFKLIKNLIIVPVMVNDKGPFNFVLDTGVGLFIITDNKLIDSLDIGVLRSITIAGFGEGEDLSAYVTPSLKVNLAHTTAKSIPAGILKKDVFDLSGYVGIPIHGLIGYDFFNSFTVRINYSNNLITIYRPDMHYIYAKGTRFPLSIEDRKPYLFTEVTLPSGNTVIAKLIVDTGAGHPISLERLNGIPIDVPPVNIKANLGVGLTGPISGHLARIQTLEIGKYKLKNVISAFPNYDEVGSKITSIDRNGNMGNSILKRFTVVFDYRRSNVYLKPGIFFKDPFEHDMSGMELSAAGKELKQIFITRVEPNSAADAAGLEVGDQITSINFKPISQINLQEIDDLFRSRNDRTFILDIIPKGEKETVRILLTLQRRI